jgi:hypothetical protein
MLKILTFLQKKIAVIHLSIRKSLIAFCLALLSFFSLVQPAWAFCGFYVGKADTSLYNQASQVIISRDKQRTILTMANDYQGSAKDFALVVPVPVILKKEQVQIGDRKIIERLDAFSAPRLVEYFDTNPCDTRRNETFDAFPAAPSASGISGNRISRKAKDLGVTIEEKFSVGEYDKYLCKINYILSPKIVKNFFEVIS